MTTVVFQSTGGVNSFGEVPNDALQNSSITVNGSGVSVSGSPVALGGTITLSTPSQGVVWTAITGATTAVAGNGYIATANAPVVTLPATSAVGETVSVMLAGATSFTVRTSGAGKITLGATNSTSNPASIQSGSSSTGAAITLVCTVQDSDWQAISAVGNFLFTVI